MRKRYIDTSVNVVTKFAGVDSFLAARKVPAGIITVNEQELPIDLLNHDIGADVTIVFFHGAIERDHTLPVLSGQGISTKVNANRIFISDPSLGLSEDLLLAWYAGNQRQDLPALLESMIAKIWADHGSKRLVFFGGSGGGFAALHFASRFPGSLAMPFNPQTDISKYMTTAVEAFTQHAFGIPADGVDGLTELQHRVTTSVIPDYARETTTMVAYIQNTNDLAHVENHMKPFLEAAHPLNKILALTGSWRDGHQPPPKELLTAALHAVCEPTDWADSLGAIGFLDARFANAQPAT